MHVVARVDSGVPRPPHKVAGLALRGGNHLVTAPELPEAAARSSRRLPPEVGVNIVREANAVPPAGRIRPAPHVPDAGELARISHYLRADAGARCGSLLPLPLRRNLLGLLLLRGLLRSALLRGLLRSLLPSSGLRLPLGSGTLPGGLLCSRPLRLLLRCGLLHFHLCSSPLVSRPLRLLLRLNLPFSSP